MCQMMQVILRMTATRATPDPFLRLIFLNHAFINGSVRKMWRLACAPVRQQLLNLLRIVNWERKLRGMGPLDPSVIRYRRKIVRPFESDNSKAA
jgi:hypothetical protein